MVVAVLAAALAARPSADAPQLPLTGDTRHETAWVADSDAGVPAIRIDAVVTDRHGKPILDLKPADFELIENGVPQKIGGVELRTPPSTVAGALAPIESPRDEESAARQPGTRVFAFFLDEFHVDPGAPSDRLRETMRRFIDEQLRPADLAVVVKPLDAVTSVRFTRDRAGLRSAVEGFAGRKGDYTPRSTFESQYIGHAPAAVAAARVQIVTAALRTLGMRFGELRADRGVIVLASEGFAREQAGRQTRVPDLQGLVRTASRFHLAMYTVNPGDPAVVGPEAPERSRNTATLQWLAAQTGGEALLAGADLPAGMRRMAADLDSYYVLTYQPAQADGRFHPVEVRAKRREAQVRARPGYWSPLGIEWRTRVATPPSPSRRALRRSPLIDAWTGLTRGADGQTRLVVSWTPRGPAGRPAQAVMLKARTVTGTSLFEGRIAKVGDSGTSGDRAVFDAPAGRIELDMTILAADGTTLDSDTRDVDIPDVRKAARSLLLMPPAIVRARSLKEFRAFSADPDATPTPERSFSRGDRLLIRVPAWDSGGAPVRVAARLLNQWGQPMRPIDSMALPGDEVPQFDLPLAWLAPGEYLIELTGSAAGSQASERITIRVTR
jgi:VWFA-related protein